MQAYGKSDIGKVRKTNEDSYICLPPAIFMVADGMGGHAAGEIASNLCTKIVCEFLQNPPPNMSWQEIIRQAVAGASSIIWQEAFIKSEYFGMGTTVTAVYIEGENVFWGHVGDSRLYHIANEKIYQVTEDHSVVWELLKKGSINDAQAMLHPNRNILTRAVGAEKEVKVDTGMMNWQSGDKLLLCSDGLTNMVSEDEILKVVTAKDIPASTEEIVNELINRANLSGGVDNITAVLIVRD